MQGIGPDSGPLRIVALATPLAGKIGLVHCPGRCGVDASGRQWSRSLDEDMAAIRAWGARIVVTAIGAAEMEHLGVSVLPRAVSDSGAAWVHLPIPDFGTPDAATLQGWRYQSPRLVACLAEGGNVLIHCAAGFGRTGTLAALLLIDLGVPPAEAVDRVRAARPGSIETREQEAFVTAYGQPHPRLPVTVWSWDLDADFPSDEAAEALLSAGEIARSRRLATSVFRRRFVAGRARLRSLLGQHLGIAPEAVLFAEGEFGKPSVVQAPGLQFSLSHSENRAMLALSDTLVVGADIERVREIAVLDLARRYFHRNEVAVVESMPDRDSRLRAFYATWVLKEAVVKALGTGLSIPLDSFEVSIAVSPPVMAIAPEGTPPAWFLWLETGDYCRAVVAPLDDEGQGGEGQGGGVGLIHRTI